VRPQALAEKKHAAVEAVTVSSLAFEVSAGGSSILSPHGRGGGGDAGLRTMASAKVDHRETSARLLYYYTDKVLMLLVVVAVERHKCVCVCACIIYIYI
jgi:hypothetical protein